MFRLSKELLSTSSNESLRAFLKRDAASPFGFLEHSGELLTDIHRHTTIDDLDLKDVFNNAEGNLELNRNKLTNIILARYPQHGERLLARYTQCVISVLGAGLENYSMDADQGIFIKVDADEMNNAFYDDNGVFYFKQTCSRLYYARLNPDLEIMGQVDVNIEVVFKEADGGYELDHIATNDEWVRDLLMGYPFKDTRWQNLLPTRHVSNGTIIPLGYRLRENFHVLFGSTDPHKSDFASFMGWPSRQTGFDVALYVLGGFLFTPLKNSVKLAIEYLPLTIVSSAAWAMDSLKKKYPRHPLAALAVGLLALTYYAAKAVGLVTRRISSPIAAAKESWKIHPLLGIASGILTVAAYAAIGFFAAPLLIGAALSAAPAIAPSVTAAVTTIASHVPVVFGLSQVSVLAASVSAAFAVVAFPLKAAASKFFNWIKQRSNERKSHNKMQAAIRAASEPAEEEGLGNQFSSSRAAMHRVIPPGERPPLSASELEPVTQLQDDHAPQPKAASDYAPTTGSPRNS